MFDFGKRLKQIREEKGVLQKELAKAINMDSVVLNRIEKDKRPARGDEIKAIADYFNVSTDYLLGRSEPNRKNALSDEQTTLLKNYDLLGTDGRNLLQALLNSLLMSHSKKYNAPNNNNYVTAM